MLSGYTELYKYCGYPTQTFNQLNFINTNPFFNLCTKLNVAWHGKIWIVIIEGGYTQAQISAEKGWTILFDRKFILFSLNGPAKRFFSADLSLCE